MQEIIKIQEEKISIKEKQKTLRKFKPCLKKNEIEFMSIKLKNREAGGC